jgi:O-antigen ligase
MAGLLLVYLLAAFGALGSLWNPVVGLSVYIGFAVLRPQYLWGWAGDLDRISYIVGVAMIAGWALHGFGSWRMGRGKSVVIALVTFGLWSWLSAVQAINTQIASESVVSLLKILVPVLVGVSTVDSERRARTLLWIVVLAQGYVSLEMNNSLGISLVTTIGTAVALGLAARRWWERVVAAAVTVLILHATLLTFSRGAFLGLIAVGITAIVIMPKRPKYLGTVLAAAIITASLTGPELSARFKTTFAESENRDASAESRLELWRDCLTVAISRPFFGVGPQNWPIIAKDYGWPDGKHAHSVWMQAAAELGFPGVLALFFFFFLTIRRLWPIARARGTGAGRSDTIFSSGIIMSIVGYMVSAQFVSLQGLEAPYYLAMVGVVLVKQRSHAVAHATEGHETLWPALPQPELRGLARMDMPPSVRPEYLDVR